ncbi:MAG: transglutaminase family protein, partial [Oscillospiraceae bacterium]
GLAVTGSGGGRRAVNLAERSFRNNSARAEYPKRVEMRTVHYSKFLSVGVCAAAIFAVSATVASLVFGKGSSIDYTAAYNLIMSIGDESGITASPFEEGPVSEYFTRPKSDEYANKLNITSPGTGEQEIIRVSYTGSSPIYLRGDIGIDFLGNSWSSPVNSEPPLWSDSLLKERYRPCEARVIHALLEARGYDTSECVNSSAVTIDYLCETSVVFLPSYTAEYSYYENELFDVYGDFAVRVNEDFGLVNTVQCTAVLPEYTDIYAYDNGADALLAVEKVFSESYCSVNSIYRTVVPEMSADEDVILDYVDYVNATYLGVPDELAGELQGYMLRSGIWEKAYSIAVQESSEAQRRYKIAKLIADYLRDNYAYSLTSPNDPNAPVTSFLNDTKSGHCSLYASSMTLLLRVLGIPARYCTGFMVDPAQGSGSGDIGSQVMKAKNLHAWCEVYLGELGWATFDPTGSSVYPERTTRPQQTTAVTTTTRQTTTAVTTTVSSVTGAQTTASTTVIEQTEPQIDLSDFIPLIIICAVILVVLILGVMAGYFLHTLKRNVEKRFRVLRVTPPETAVNEIYRLILSVLEIYGFRPQNGEMPTAFFARADKTFGTSLSQDAELLEALAFGSPEANETQRGVLLHHLKVLYNAASAKNSPLRRIRMRITLGSK